MDGASDMSTWNERDVIFLLVNWLVGSNLFFGLIGWLCHHVPAWPRAIDYIP